MQRNGVEPSGMAEIATLAGVAVSTVSRALSGQPGVSQRRREEILRIARAVGYVPEEAVVPRSGTRHHPRITAVIPEAERWIFGSILSGLNDVLSPAGVSLEVRQGMSASERTSFLADPHIGDSADAVVLVPAPRDLTAERIRSLPIPAIIAGTLVDGVTCAGVDDREIGEKATNHLLNLGLTRIVSVGFLDHDGTPGIATRRRAEGYERRLERAQLPAKRLELPYGDDSGRRAAELLLTLERLPEGIVCASDEMAAEMMTVFRQAGVSIPGDVALIGVDDHPIAAMVGLTTIAQPAREQGRAAAELALATLQGGAAQMRVLPTHLIVRETTRRKGSPTQA